VQWNNIIGYKFVERGEGEGERKMPRINDTGLVY